MMRIDLHPEDLLERAARGTASDADWTRLEQHLAECAVCRVERALSAQAALDAAPLRDEKLVVARLKRAVAARLASPSASRARRKSTFVAVALAAGALCSVAAAATLVIVRRAPAPLESASTKPLVGAAPVLASPRPMKAEQPRGVATGEVEVAEPSIQPPVKSVPQPARPAPVAAIEPSSASELFSRANRARRDGNMTEAVRLYRTLQEHFAGTSEELVSRVTLGRLLLDRLGDSRGALVQFNSYLASPGGGALREEAMVGRALSLGRMGRTAEERTAWKALLDAWPKSAHRKRAEARLTELGGADVAGTVDARAGTGNGRSERTQ
ncbi:MAG TPA: hypothetical protein VG937_06225 [Polyangiaceae bacterium]|nr:hypothetical protein [Polyangiaceae bacterium]